MINWINELFVNALNWIYSWVHNYGWSVVVFTAFIRLIVLPLDIKSRKAMRATQKIQPKIQALQKKYANDKEKLNQKTMELYRKEHVSPTAGCLPMLFQWPVLIFMFTAMRVVGNEHTIRMILDMKDGIAPTLQSWLWIKNVFQPDSFMSTILPAAGDKLLAISQVSYSKILTAENIEIAREFLTTPEYATLLTQYGGEAFRQVQLNFVFFKPLLTLPTSFANLFQYANGLFLLPILAGLSQFLMTKVTMPSQPKPEGEIAKQEDDPAAAANNAMNSGFMKWFFPLFSVWICATATGAFSIYWMAVNVIMIVENVALNKWMEHQDAVEAAKKAAETIED
ncbi:MAG: YidC/Oxa1 family membrane protein insertase [Clostridia bacterium]|nr:YidC/Oxa1 family membrane protein insertase [Clostridia bacterium]